MTANVFYQENKISRDSRASAIGNGKFRGCTIWFTGLSGAGKSTIAFGVEEYLIERGVAAYTLDGDNIRHGLNSDLGFSATHREENIRRVAEVARLFADSGMIALSSFISPFQKDRDRARVLHEKAGLPFFECFVDTPLEVCESRDVKGLYKKARDGLIKSFTGIDQPYQRPPQPELSIRTDRFNITSCIRQVVLMLEKVGILDAALLGQPVPLYKQLNGTSTSNEKSSPIKKEFEVDAETKVMINGVGDLQISNGKLQLLTAKAIQAKVELNEVDLQWVQVLAEGWATPLRGFMREQEYLSCLHFGTIRSDGVCHSQAIPIVLAINDAKKQELQNLFDQSKSRSVNLVFQSRTIGRLDDTELFPHRKRERAARIFGTLDRRHPSVARVLSEGDWLLGGDLQIHEHIRWNDGLDEYRLTPMELQDKLQQMGADAVFVFQLRNPVHNGHALLMNDTRRMLMEKGFKHPVLLLHPLGGWTKDDDVPLPVRIRQHLAVLKEGILDSDSTLIAIFPSPMSYAGPKEVQWHAKARLFTGAHFYIVGRDPAGINDPDTNEPLYEPTDGGRVLAMTPGLRHMQIIPFRVAAYDRMQGRMNFLDNSRVQDFEFISGTKMRNLARNGDQPPDGFMGKKAWKVLAEYYNSIRQE